MPSLPPAPPISPPPSPPPPPPLLPPPSTPPGEEPLPCTAIVGAACAGPDEPCYRDERCSPTYTDDPFGGLGCGAGGHGLCRFCGFGLYLEVQCPRDLIAFEVIVSGTVETFDEAAYASSLAALVGVAVDDIALTVTPASVAVIAVITTNATAARVAITATLHALTPASASSALAVAVIGLVPPIVTSEAEQLNAQVAAALSTSSNGDDAARSPLALIVAAALVAMVVAIGAFVYRRRRRAAAPGHAAAGKSKDAQPSGSSTPEETNSDNVDEPSSTKLFPTSAKLRASALEGAAIMSSAGSAVGGRGGGGGDGKARRSHLDDDFGSPAQFVDEASDVLTAIEPSVALTSRKGRGLPQMSARAGQVSARAGRSTARRGDVDAPPSTRGEGPVAAARRMRTATMAVMASASPLAGALGRSSVVQEFEGAEAGGGPDEGAAAPALMPTRPTPRRARGGATNKRAGQWQKPRKAVESVADVDDMSV